jgi:hypothetical protein
VMRTIHLTVAAAIAALAFASSALALGGSAYAQISADWGPPVSSTCTYSATTASTALPRRPAGQP